MNVEKVSGWSLKDSFVPKLLRHSEYQEIRTFLSILYIVCRFYHIYEIYKFFTLFIFKTRRPRQASAVYPKTFLLHIRHDRYYPIRESYIFNIAKTVIHLKY